ncbi:acVLRF1 family peptidyl-tRNA hydrolase [Nocardioides sp.]|uniref:acVLRF1 family peptidyl-tRNA hydrolase n=1 Tax=Nocardioides sp. TaxID=35761 RepID=UPI003516D13B
MSEPVVVLVPGERWARWSENFASRHGAPTLSVDGGALVGVAADGSRFAARLPFGGRYDGAADGAGLVAAIARPEHWGVLLVRRGGFAIARLEGARIVASKVGQRHVQGRTKAGGQSQQRFARRRDNQARAAFEAAAEHAVTVLGRGGAGVPELPVVTGGDRAAVADVLDDTRLSHLRPGGHWFAVPDPRRAVLDGVVEQSVHLVVQLENA